MDPGVFVNRRKELNILEEAWNRGRGLVLVYGRRRIGKTRLLLEWARDKPHVYYQAGMYSHEINLAGLARAFEEQLGLQGFSKARYPGVDVLLEYASKLWRDRLAIIIDEITYWARSYPGVISEIQRFVDHVLQGSGMVLVLSGSIVGVVLREIAGGGAPLYGRARVRMKLHELPPWCIASFLPGYSPNELVEVFSLVGGIPRYLVEWRSHLSPLEAYLNLFAPDGVLEDEPLMLLRDEVRNPAPYTSILRALAEGKRTLGEISGFTGLPVGHVSRYLSTLMLLGLVEYEPLVPERRKRRLLRLRDRLLYSYYHIIEPTRYLLTVGRGRRIIERRFREVVADGWEQLAAQHALSVLSNTLKLEISRAGRLLHKGVGVDYVIVDDMSKRVLAVEAKWSKISQTHAIEIAKRVRARVNSILPGYTISIAIYTRDYEGTKIGGDLEIITPGDLSWNTGCT
ncbi:MAG: ATP-binding protein [Desulfurococcales archaeon]|nr:ATP-binding protein [Desulfurococcales archaeon]